MTTAAKRVSVIEHCGVAPAAAAGGATELCFPLTYFDMVWLNFHPIQRLLFHQYPCSTIKFQETIIPNLKKSLSQTLRHYLPLAGNLFYPMDSCEPELRYGFGDSVIVTFAESSEAFDFSYLTSNQARDADDFHYFVRDLPESRIDSESGFKIIPLLAIQVTHFPETGICVGITNHHVVGDASSIVGFIKAWSSVAKLGHLAENHALPFHDRSVIKDPTGRAHLFWNQLKAFPNIGSPQTDLPTNKVRATFLLRKNDIQALKDSVLAREPGAGSIHLSSFTVTISYAWACFAKSAAEAGEVFDDDEAEYFGFAVDARSRQEPPVPAAYFGNCIGGVVAESTHGQLKGKDGYFVAAEKIGELISKKVNKVELLRDADDWLLKYGPLKGKRVFGVSGSPKFDLYDTDFGWGTPNKFESVSIDGESSISLCKSREFEGGLEIGVSLPKKKMDAFEAAFYDGLKRQHPNF